jgi:hypothetical protein
MSISYPIPPSVVIARDESDENIKQIRQLEQQIEEVKKKERHLSADLASLKEERQKNIKIPLRPSAMWCIEIDADNPKFFLKSVEGVSKCIGYKHSIEIDTPMRNKIATTLSWLFNNKLLGRFSINGISYYGLIEFFIKDKNGLYTELKQKYLRDLEVLVK